MCVPWESNPQPFALLTQCSTTEEHMVFIKLALRTIFWYFINVIFYYSDYFSLYYILYICFAN